MARLVRATYASTLPRQSARTSRAMTAYWKSRCKRELALDLLEVDPLHHGQALQEAAQAIEGQFDGAQSDPFAAAQNA